MANVSFEQLTEDPGHRRTNCEPDAVASQATLRFQQDSLRMPRPVSLGGLKTQHVYRGNFLHMAPELPDQCIDLIIADPPYNASKGGVWSMNYGTLPGFGGDWKKISQVWDDMTLEEYLAFTLGWAIPRPSVC